RLCHASPSGAAEGTSTRAKRASGTPAAALHEGLKGPAGFSDRAGPTSASSKAAMAAATQGSGIVMGPTFRPNLPIGVLTAETTNSSGNTTLQTSLFQRPKSRKFDQRARCNLL